MIEGFKQIPPLIPTCSSCKQSNVVIVFQLLRDDIEGHFVGDIFCDTCARQLLEDMKGA